MIQLSPLRARVAGALRPFWVEFSLRAIVAPRVSSSMPVVDEMSFTLLTTGGSQIHWGRSPGTKHPGELSAEQKVGRLQKYLQDFGSFATPDQAFEIDIRHWQEISRRPMHTQRTTRF